MATAHDSWLEGNCGVDSRDDARDEFVAQRTKELTAERLADENQVATALSESIGFYEEGERLIVSLARFRSAYHLAETDCGIAEAGRLLALELDEAATAPIARDASTDAEHEASLRFPEHDDRDPEGSQAVAA